MTMQDSAVHVTRVIPGRPERVFAAWTEAETFARWFAPHGYDVAEIDIDPRVGGRYRVTVTGPRGDRHTTTGVYTEVSPPHRLAMSWTYSGDHPDAQREETHLVVECHPHAAGTELRLVHTQLATDRARANVAGGWQGCLDKLEAIVGMASPRPPDLSARPHACTASHTYPCPPGVLYRAWTEEMDRWFARPGSVAMVAEVGRPFFFEAGPETARYPHYGRFLRLEADRRVEMTWVTGPDGTGGAETIVTVELAPHGNGTIVSLCHAGFADEASMVRHRKAWPQVLAHLEQRLATSPDAADHERNSDR